MSRLNSTLVVTAVALFALVTVVSPASADHHDSSMTVEQVVAKHIAAKGGQDAWNAIESLKLSGDSTAFSKVRPFTMYKTRDRKYRLDHAWDELLVLVGFDGETAWTDNRFFGKGARLVEGPDRAVLERDLDFATPFFDIESAGHTVTLLGPQDLEGQPVIAIQLKRADESEETWYLDSSSYLEVARDSPGSDFGRPMPQRTFFDNFQEVAGVMIPQYTETQWYTRHRVLDAQTVEANVEIDEGLFPMPPPFGMEKLQSLAGSWAIAVEARPDPSGSFSKSDSQSTIESSLRGGRMEETWTEPDGTEAVRVLSFDQFRDRYIATQINSSTNAMDILAGTWDDQGALVLDDVVTETPSLLFGMTIYERIRLFDIEPDSFKIERESSIDGGENWAVMQKLSYTRKSELDDAEADTE